MITQAVKKQRCMKIDPETGAVHYIEKKSSEDEEREALGQLGLWRYAGYDAIPSFLASDGDQKAVMSPDLENTVSIEALRAKAIGNSQKGYMECSLLLVMTDLINNQEYLTLQTCMRPAILPRGIALPPGQVVEIRRKDFKSATDILRDGLAVSRKVTTERRLFAKGILEIRKNWRVLSHASILATKKHLQQRVLQLDGRERETMYIDCSYVSSGDKLASLEEFLVPLRIGPKGPVLDPKELEVTSKTLKLSLVSRSNREVVSSVTAWSSGADLVDKNNLDDSPRTNPEVLSSGCVIEDELENILISRIHSHCRRRQHDALSKRLFARLRKTAIEDHDRRIVQPTLQKSKMKNLSELKNLSEDTENKNDSRNDFALYEGRLIGSLEIATVGKGRIELNFSDELLLVITLELIIVPPTALLPLSAPALPSRVSTNEKINDDTSTSNDDGNKKISNANDLKWLTRLLFNSILQAQLLLLSHWKKSLDLLQESARQERERERESSITTAATSTKSDSTIKSSDVMIKIEKIEHKVMVAIKTENIIKTENTTTKPTNNSPNIPTASSLVEVSSKEHCSENHSVSLSSVNFFHRLVNPVLRGRARDVGDGIANALASTASEALTANRNIKMIKNENNLLSLSSNLSSSGNSKKCSDGDLILLGMVDLIRSGIQKQRVFQILKTVKSDIFNILKINIQYEFIPNNTQSKRNAMTKIRIKVENETSDDLWIEKEKEKEKLKSEFLYSEKVDFSILLPDSTVFISATPRYGFEVKSVIMTAGSSLASSSSTSSSSLKEGLHSNDQCESPSSSSSSSLLQYGTRSRHQGGSLSGFTFTKCDSLYHPMNARFDSPRHLSQFLSSMALGAYLSVALSRLVHGSSVAATQVTPTFFSLFHQYIRNKNDILLCSDSGSGSGSAPANTTYDGKIDGSEASMSISSSMMNDSTAAHQGKNQQHDDRQSESKKSCDTISSEVEVEVEVGIDRPLNSKNDIIPNEKFIANIKIETVRSLLVENHGNHIGDKIKIVVTFSSIIDRRAVLNEMRKMEVGNGNGIEMEMEMERDMDVSNLIELTFDADGGVNLLDSFVQSLLILYPLPPSAFSCPSSTSS